MGIAAMLIGNTFGGRATAEDAQKAKEAIQRGRLIGAKRSSAAGYQGAGSSGEREGGISPGTA